MKKGILSVLFTSVLISCNAQQVQTREVSPFSRMQVSGSVEVFYTDTSITSVIIKGSGKEIDRVETRVENETLKISNKGSFSEPVRVYVKNNRLEHLDCGGAVQFRTTNIIRPDNFALDASGSATVRLKVNTKTLTIGQTGASSVVLNGSSDSLGASIGGAASLKAFNLETKKANVVTTGAAHARVFATESVMANAGGASDIKIKGEPRNITAETSAAASVSRVKNTDGKKGGDTTAYNWNKKKIIVISGAGNDDEDEKKPGKKQASSGDFQHWSGVAIGTNGYLNPAGSLNLSDQHNFMELNYGRSFNLQLNLFEKDFRLVKNYVRLVTGFGIDFHWYQFANKTRLNPDTAYTWGSVDSSNSLTYRKNSLRSIYLQVPLLLEFNTGKNPAKSFHIAFGVIGQYQVGSRVKQVVEQDKYEITSIRKDGFNQSPFALKAHVNLGYSRFTVFGEYSLTPLFQPNKGPELYPFAAGIRIIPFS